MYSKKLAVTKGGVRVVVSIEYSDPHKADELFDGLLEICQTHISLSIGCETAIEMENSES
jgi:hypothetical protein